MNANTNIDMTIATNDVAPEAEPTLEARIAEAVGNAVRHAFEAYAIVETDDEDDTEEVAYSRDYDDGSCDTLGELLDGVSDAMKALTHRHRVYLASMECGGPTQRQLHALEGAAVALQFKAAVLRSYYLAGLAGAKLSTREMEWEKAEA